MTCEQCQDYFAAYEDGTLEPEKVILVRDHLEACKECELLFASLADYHRIIYSYKEKEKTHDPILAASIMEKMDDWKARESWWVRFWNGKYAGKLAYASASLAVFLVGYFVWGVATSQNQDLPTTGTIAAQHVAEDSLMEAPEGIVAGEPRIAAPFEVNDNPNTFVFDIPRNYAEIHYSHQGSNQSREMSLSFNGMQDLVAEMMLLKGRQEMNTCPSCAEKYFSFILEKMPGTRHSEEARAEISRLVLTENP